MSLISGKEIVRVTDHNTSETKYLSWLDTGRSICYVRNKLNVTSTDLKVLAFFFGTVIAYFPNKGLVLITYLCVWLLVASVKMLVAINHQLRSFTERDHFRRCLVVFNACLKAW